MSMYVSNYISNEEISKWKNGDNIILKAETGQGKSFFIQNKLLKYTTDNFKGNICHLVHRDLLKQQASLMSTIDVISYQTIETRYKYNIGEQLDNYDYIVADEAHSAFLDSDFNKYSDITLNSLINNNRAIKIYLSATPELLTEYFKENNIEYTLIDNMPKTHRVKSVELYKNDDHLIQRLQNIDCKALVFKNSKEKIFDMTNKFMSCTYITSDTKDSKVYQTLIEDEMFNSQILLATNVIDAGINIKDDKVKIVHIDSIDLANVKQQLGRVRNNKVKLMMKINHGNKFKGKLRRYNEIKNNIDLWITNPKEIYIKLGRDFAYYTGYMIQDSKTGERVLNKIRYFKLRKDIEFLSSLIDAGESEFIKRVFEYLGINTKETKITFTKDILDETSGCLLINKYLELDYFNERTKEKFCNDIFSTELKKNYNKSKVLKISTINKMLEELGLNYKIKSKRIRICGKQKYVWYLTTK